MKENNFGNHTKNLKELTNKQHMKTEIINQEQKAEWKFPCLGKNIDTGFVVLFKEYGTGTVLIPDHRIGEYFSAWIMKSFTPITDPTTIKFIP